MKRISLLLFVAGFSVMLLSGCNKDDCSVKEACCLEPDPGNCFAAFPKYYFDQAAGECREFTWGGCDGVVPFETLAECEACDCAK